MSKRVKKQRSGGHESLAKVLAPEEIRIGDFVAVLTATYEFPSFLWSASDFCAHTVAQSVRINFITCDGGEPRKILSVCLPFVTVARPQGRVEVLDVRQYHLARLNRSYAKTAWKALSGKKCNI